MPRGTCVLIVVEKHIYLVMVLPVSSRINQMKGSLAKLEGIKKGSSATIFHPKIRASTVVYTCQEATCHNCNVYDRKHTQPPCDYKGIEKVATASRMSLLQSLDTFQRMVEVKECGEQTEKLKLKNCQTNETKITDYYDKLSQALEKMKEDTIQKLPKGSEAHLQEIEAW